MEKITINITVNGKQYEKEIPPRRLLSDFLRHDLGLTGTHVGCEHGVCGMCTVLIDGQSARSCLNFAVMHDGASIETVESLGTPTNMHPLQEGFWAKHGLQCGFCTPAMLMVSKELLDSNPDPSREEIKEAISANLCRCTGYQTILDSVEAAVNQTKEEVTA
ncbi:MAG: (2Fe-2S)-binding protein [Ardenticatenaceae bacterium]|nr:(2Fe-2S)-binding protein [Ardenticatenaceae bacterium]